MARGRWYVVRGECVFPTQIQIMIMVLVLHIDTFTNGVVLSGQFRKFNACCYTVVPGQRKESGMSIFLLLYAILVLRYKKELVAEVETQFLKKETTI